MASRKRDYSDVTDSPQFSSARCFCCMQLRPMTPPHGIHDGTIMEFATRMTQLIFYSSNPCYSQSTLTTLLQDAAYLVKYQKCVYGEIVETRYFLPHPTLDKFMEIEEAMVKNHTDDQGNTWRDSMRYLKLSCEIHGGPYFMCRIVQKEQRHYSQMEEEYPAVKKIDLLDRISTEILRDRRDKSPSLQLRGSVKSPAIEGSLRG